MSSAFIAKLGILFLVLGLCATFLMYWLWGFPFDKETRTSAAPKPLMYLHRVLGYLFVICYVLIMWHMVPRLWTYQVEFPTRTVAHIIIGLTVGFLLLIKIAIMRFFRHFEEWMPYLGTSIMLGTVLLIGLSVPFIFREKALAAAAPGGSVYSADSRARVAELLPAAGLPKGAPGVDVLSSIESLRKGRHVLLHECVKCHDLRTILIKPRTPANWLRTVERMAEKPALFDPLTLEQQWYVTAYLVAITPDLQESVKLLRVEKQMMKKAQKASAEVALVNGNGGDDEGSPQEAGGGKANGTDDSEGASAGANASASASASASAGEGLTAKAEKMLANIDPDKAKMIYEEQCSQCHELEDVDNDPPESAEDIDELVERMIENGMEDVSQDDFKLIKWYLLNHYVEKSAK